MMTVVVAAVDLANVLHDRGKGAGVGVAWWRLRSRDGAENVASLWWSMTRGKRFVSC